MQRVCHFHAGCPDGFGAAWAVWRAWGDEARYVPSGHDDQIDASQYRGNLVLFADIAPPNQTLRALAGAAGELVVLDHHLSSQKRYESDPDLAVLIAQRGHRVHFDQGHSGAVLAWQHIADGEPVPELLAYVEDQDLWSWKLPHSEEVNAAISSYPRLFEVWNDLYARPIADLVREGTPLVRSNRIEVERILVAAHRITIDSRQIEAVNATQLRSSVGHALAMRARYGSSWGCVYRVQGDRVDASLYSIGELDVSEIAASYRGGGHRNAAGFSVPLHVWLDEMV